MSLPEHRYQVAADARALSGAALRLRRRRSPTLRRADLVAGARRRRTGHVHAPDEPRRRRDSWLGPRRLWRLLRRARRRRDGAPRALEEGAFFVADADAARERLRLARRAES